MVKINTPDGHVDSPRLLHEDQTVNVKWRFFFTRDMKNFERFIVNQTDAT